MEQYIIYGGIILGLGLLYNIQVLLKVIIKELEVLSRNMGQLCMDMSENKDTHLKNEKYLRELTFILDPEKKRLKSQPVELANKLASEFQERKIAAIKEFRDITDTGLKEAKEYIDKAYESNQM